MMDTKAVTREADGIAQAASGLGEVHAANLLGRQFAKSALHKAAVTGFAGHVLHALDGTSGAVRVGFMAQLTEMAISGQNCI